jgi:hypothetical protein
MHISLVLTHQQELLADMGLHRRLMGETATVFDHYMWHEFLLKSSPDDVIALAIAEGTGEQAGGGDEEEGETANDVPFLELFLTPGGAREKTERE